MTKIQEERKRLFEELGSTQAVADRLGVTVTSVRKVLQRVGISPMAEYNKRRSGTPDMPVSAPAVGKAIGMSREAFKAQFDPATKALRIVRNAVASLTDPDTILTDIQFKSDRCAGINAAFYRNIVDMEEFRPYRFRKGDKLFWASPETTEWALATVAQVREL